MGVRPSEIKRLEEKLYKLFNLGNYKGDLELAEYILKYDFLNIKAYRKKMEMVRKSINI